MIRQKPTKTITTAYTTTDSDNGYRIICNSSSTLEITLHSATGRYNFELEIDNIGSGEVTVGGKTLKQDTHAHVGNNGGSVWSVVVGGGSMTKAEIEAVLTGEIETHTHPGGGTVTKADVEAVLTGEISSHTHAGSGVSQATETVIGGVRAEAIEAGILESNKAKIDTATGQLYAVTPYGPTEDRPEGTSTDAVKVLMHLDSNFYNVGPLSVEAKGSAAISTAWKKFGAASVRLPGESSYINILDVAIGTQDFTFDFWVRLDSVGRTHILLSLGGSNTGSFGVVRISPSNVCGIYANGVKSDGTAVFAANTDYHVAVIGSGSAIKIYVNGALDSTWTVNYNVPTQTAAIGANQSAYYEALTGYIDEFRFCLGTQMWTANFTPPNAPYDVASFAVAVGTCYFDTTLGKPVWWTGTEWVVMPTVQMLSQATETVLGGIKAKAKTTETAEVAIDTSTGKLYAPTESTGGETEITVSSGAITAVVGAKNTSALTISTTESDLLSATVTLAKKSDIMITVAANAEPSGAGNVTYKAYSDATALALQPVEYMPTSGRKYLTTFCDFISELAAGSHTLKLAALTDAGTAGIAIGNAIMNLLIQVSATLFTATGGTISTSGDYTYHVFDADDDFEITSGSSTIEMLAWGGGGGADGGFTNTGHGGGGGYAFGKMDVAVGDIFKVKVGGGGLAMAPGAGPGAVVNGGGGQCNTSGYGGQGGGLSGIFATSYTVPNALLIAGGGGGSGCDSNSQGGPGGGSSGVTGTGGGAGGGGTQSGSTGYPAGTQLQGGTPNTSDGGGGGGGGGGYWGGGAGGCGSPTDSGGGGGSGYYSSTYVTDAVLTAGSLEQPGNASETLRGTAGVGGVHGSNPGTAGRVVIRYLTP